MPNMRAIMERDQIECRAITTISNNWSNMKQVLNTCPVSSRTFKQGVPFHVLYLMMTHLLPAICPPIIVVLKLALSYGVISLSASAGSGTHHLSSRRSLSGVRTLNIITFNLGEEQKALEPSYVHVICTWLQAASSQRWDVFLTFHAIRALHWS